MIYVPVLRYRREEIKALKSTKLSNKSMPLLEIVTELAGQCRKGDFESTYLKDFESYNYDFMIDIPMYMNINKGTRPNVEKFILKFQQNPDLIVDYYEKLNGNKHIIPVISYDAKTKYQKGFYTKTANRLRQTYNRLSFRVFNTLDSVNVLNEVSNIILSDDILLYDLDKRFHTDHSLVHKYKTINNLKNKKGFASVIIRSAINPDIIFKNMVDSAIEKKADNSLLKDCTKYGFDCFGDFVGIRKDRTIPKGGGSEESAGFLFYSWHSNSYIGFRGRVLKYSEFLDHIKPSLMCSQYWKSYSLTHHNNCPGCLSVANNATTNTWDWKRYSIQHYLYTMEEYL